MRKTVLIAALSVMAGALPASAAEPLASYGVDIDQTSVSGISSGGAMAVQMHIAHSSIMKGVGVTAGISYDCANSDQHLDEARLENVGKCMQGKIPPSASKQMTHEAAQANAIDAVENLTDQKVWLLHGTADKLVAGKAMQSMAEYYKSYVDDANVLLKILPNANHSQITDDYGADCPAFGEYYISDCDYDSAGALLQFIYGGYGFQPRNNDALSGSIRTFDQAPFTDGDPKPYGLADTGYLYVPASCDGGSATCRVHVVFHGCKQSAEFVGDAFYTHAGYNEWADTNDIIVLYPQTTAIPVLGYINLPALDGGCWDWFGYAGFDLTGHYDANYARKSGHQISAIRGMLDCLARAPGQAC